MRRRADDRRPDLGEVLAVWGALAATGGVILVTYSRLHPSLLYGVSRRGIAGGASRLVMFLNWPGAVIAPATVPFALARLDGRARRRAAAAALASLPLCAWVARPGVVSEEHIDARATNAAPVAGVAIAFGLTLADVGLYVDRLPALGRVFIGSQPTPGRPDLASVHFGHHEGMDGVLLALSAVALARPLPALPRGFRRLVAPYIALMLTYGAAVAAGDAWHEQVVKRGLARRNLPNVLRPAPTRAWAGLLAATALVWRRLR
jgi:hypothetical protein